MNSKKVLSFFVLSLFIISILSFASAGFFSNFWNKMTGEAVSTGTAYPNIPINCTLWYDGCNNCNVSNGKIINCTKNSCFRLDTPRCLKYTSQNDSRNNTLPVIVNCQSNTDCPPGQECYQPDFYCPPGAYCPQVMPPKECRIISSTNQTNCNSEGKMCGGIAAIKCCSGLKCDYRNQTYADVAGICVKDTSSPTCTDSDGGLNYYVKGRTNGNHEDLCFINKNWASWVKYDINGLYERYCCDLGAGMQTCTKEFSCPNGCVDGACVSINTTINQTCADSDGGLNYYVNGIIKNANNLQGESWSDVCYNNTLFEGSCRTDGSNEYNQNIYDCPNGCLNGACVSTNQTTNSTCTDSDGGKNIYGRGTMKTSFGLESYSVTDFCITPIYGLVVAINSSGTFGEQVNECPIDKYDQKQDSVGDCYIMGYDNISSCLAGENCFVNEYFCFGSPQGGYDADHDEFFRCPNGCVDGSCIKENKTYCEINADCPKGQECYQPPMPKCEEGMACPQVMPPKECRKIKDEVVCEGGCVFNKKCYPLGYRKGNQYCSANNTFLDKKINGVVCDNNFECRSKLCVQNKCMNQGLFNKMFGWFKKN